MSCPDVSPAEERRSGLERRRPSAPALPRLTIIAISVAFGEFWNDLAADLDVAIDLFARDVEAIPFGPDTARSEEHTSELQSRPHLVCRLLLEKKKKHKR